jgi:predicted DNA-binding transcriptional regulator AlpA
MDPADRILTKKEAAARLRLSDRSLDRLCESNSALRKMRLSPRRVGFLARDIDAFIEGCMPPSAAGQKPASASQHHKPCGERT